VTEVADAISTSLLRGARGNSGVILSLLFRGFATACKGHNEISAEQMVTAFEKGVEAGYKAVMKPTEGTILTVARVSAEKARAAVANTNDTVKIMQLLLTEAKIVLDQTPNMLPVLKQAKVVDAGGMGWVHILEGMLSVMKDGVIIEPSELSAEDLNTAADFSQFETEEINFAYCTEFLIAKLNPAQDTSDLQNFLGSIGDSVVCVDDGEIVKVHVHTDRPDKAMSRALKIGDLQNIKIENMKEQHASIDATVEEDDPADYKDYGFISVAAGDGIAAVFGDLGADQIILGGQTMNPSTDDILNAAKKVKANTIFILPNNKNIILAAEQAAELSEKKMVVIPTKTIPQGIAALFAFDPDTDEQVNINTMTEASGAVISAQITFAARDSEFDGNTITRGDILTLIENKVTFIDKDIVDGVINLGTYLAEKDLSYLTVFYGEDVSEAEAEEMQTSLSSVLGEDVEITLIAGGQPVYYYIISAE